MLPYLTIGQTLYHFDQKSGLTLDVILCDRALDTCQ
jgi:hypothetical protein